MAFRCNVPWDDPYEPYAVHMGFRSLRKGVSTGGETVSTGRGIVSTVSEIVSTSRGIVSTYIGQ